MNALSKATAYNGRLAYNKNKIKRNNMKITIQITEQEIKDLKLNRNYFGEHDVTMLEHLAYSVLDKLVKKLITADAVDCASQLVDCADCDYRHNKTERVEKKGKFWTTYHCPKCDSESTCRVS